MKLCEGAGWAGRVELEGNRMGTGIEGKMWRCVRLEVWQWVSEKDSTGRVCVVWFIIYIYHVVIVGCGDFRNEQESECLPL